MSEQTTQPVDLPQPVERRIEGADCVLALRGPVPIELIRDFHQTALEAADSACNVVLDCAPAEHLDGCTLQVLLALKVALENAGRSIRLRGANEQIRNYLEWAGLAAHFGEAVSEGAPGASASVEKPAAIRPRKPRAPRKRRS